MTPMGETRVDLLHLLEDLRDAYPGSTWDRLAAIKARYDPTNLFRLNQNIPPGNVTPGK